VAISRSGFEKTNLIHLLTGHKLEDIVDFDLNPVGKGYMFFGKSNPRIQHIIEVINASAENNLEQLVAHRDAPFVHPDEQRTIP
jgi:hypothetical protein